MTAATWTGFLLTAAVIVVTPGTGSLYTVATGLARGSRAAVLAAVACTLGVLPHLLAAVTGLAALLHASGVAFAVLKYLGVAYLLLLAVATWRGRREPLELGEGATSTPRVLGEGITLNLLNPKLTLFFFAFLPQFVPAGTPHASARMALLGGVFAALTFVVFSAYGVAAGTLRTRVLARPRLVERLRAAFAASFAVLAGRLALESR
ncbi:LysE family translocator [uncultured Nocardioides sp.]|uniref:LysE family translocator n=1 Tax=uncultured Nocardioides sp. TaxID=198441 RepID=UPI00263745C5|nr:LysE family translocator [uncultured Nocardioides sp.]